MYIQHKLLTHSPFIEHISLMVSLLKLRVVYACKVPHFGGKLKTYSLVKHVSPCPSITSAGLSRIFEGMCMLASTFNNSTIRISLSHPACKIYAL
jgi:hypothetical protein